MGTSWAFLVHTGGRDGHGCVPLRLVSAGGRDGVTGESHQVDCSWASLDSVKDAFTLEQCVQSAHGCRLTAKDAASWKECECAGLYENCLPQS